MNATTKRPTPTLDELRAEAERLGITDVFTGGAFEELLSVARDNPDPFGYLAIHAPGGPAEGPEAGESGEGRVERTEAAEEEITEPIGDVPAPLPASALEESVSISVPLFAAPSRACYISTHVEVRMSREQGVSLRRLQLALDAKRERLANGRCVSNAADAVRWLLEQLQQI